MADNAVDRTIFVLNLSLISYLNEEKKRKFLLYPATVFIETLWIGAALIFRQKLIEENEPKRKYSTAMVML
jgi:hypothetical protein